MKRIIAFLFLFIFLTGFTTQVCKNYFCDDNSIENVAENKDDSKKESEDFPDFLKDKILFNSLVKLPNFNFQLKQYIDHIFQYKNPHLDVEINPPKTKA